MKIRFFIVLCLFPGWAFCQVKTSVVPTDTIAPGKMKHLAIDGNELNFSIRGDSLGEISIKYNDIPYLQQYNLSGEWKTINLKLNKSSNTIVIHAEPRSLVDSFSASIELSDGDHIIPVFAQFKKNRSDFIFVRRK